MSREALIIAMDLIEVLAKPSNAAPNATRHDLEQESVKRVIEAARTNYVLPSFCAEMNTDTKKCIRCIVEHIPPVICREKMNEPVIEDFDIGWEGGEEKR